MAERYARYERQVRSMFEVHRRNGDEWLISCPDPDHTDEHPSAYVNVDKGVWFCHSCGASGSVCSGDGDVNVEVTVARIRELAHGEDSCPDHVAPDESELSLYVSGVRAQMMWKRIRGIGVTTARRFRLAYDPYTNSLVIPVWDLEGKYHGVIKRSLDEGARRKYMYPAGFARSGVLYASREALETSKGKGWIALCEGSIDALAMWDAGVPAVAMLGSYASRAQIEAMRLVAGAVVVCTDDDPAGASARTQVKLAARGVVRCTFPDWGAVGTHAKDPASLSRRDRARLFMSGRTLARG